MKRWEAGAAALASTLLVVSCSKTTASSQQSSTKSPGIGTTSSSSEPVAFSPGDLTVGPDGAVYASDCVGGYVFRVDPNGAVHVIAGIGISSPNGGISKDGVPATEAELDCPAGLAFDARGDLLIADHANNRIRLIDAKGVISTIAGNGPVGTAPEGGPMTGDGGPAAEASLQEPVGIQFDANGNLLIADRDDHAVRRIDRKGDLSTIAGTGKQSYTGDGGAATKAAFVSPVYVVPDSRGNLYVSDDEAQVIRIIDPSGVITTFAGTGKSGYSGDGGLATKATFSSPEGLAFDRSGNLYVADLSNHVVRMIDPTGTITTFAGTGQAGCAADGRPANKAKLSDPSGLALDGRGDLFVADGTCGIVRIDRKGVLTIIAPAVV